MPSLNTISAPSALSSMSPAASSIRFPLSPVAIVVWEASATVKLIKELAS